MTFMAVTTFNAEGLAKYGRKMIDSFHRQWPDTVGMRVYSEGWREEMPGACVVDLETSSDWLTYFKARHRERPTSNYRMDAVRFSHKIAALIAADEHMSSQYLIWMDGDIFTHSPIKEADLATLVPTNGAWVAWLPRKFAYPECGFYIIDRLHARHSEMMGRLRAMYDGDQLFAEKEWHDSYIMQRVVEQAGIVTTNLSGKGYGTAHPFINGPLGKWMDHMKGKRKEKGRSHGTDLRVRREEQYWR